MLNAYHRDWRDSARQFARRVVAPLAAEIDRDQVVPPDIVAALANKGFLGAALPDDLGGGGLDPLAYGLTNEEIGRACSSVRSVMTTHNMVAQTLARFATAAQKDRWLPGLVSGEKMAAFALSEPAAGSAPRAMQSEATAIPGGYSLNGVKCWITNGQRADLFLTFARVGGQHTAFLIDSHAAGLSVTPRHDAFGIRGAMMADLRFQDVFLSDDTLIGKIGAGLSFVAGYALDHGRYSVAWGSLGILRACLEACLDHAETRQIGGTPQLDLPLVQQAIAEIWIGYESARAMCHKAARYRDEGHAHAGHVTSAAKFLAAREAIAAANTAVRLHGAQGCSPDSPVGRYLRDATVMGIIEGPQETHMTSLARYAAQRDFLE